MADTHQNSKGAEKRAKVGAFLILSLLLASSTLYVQISRAEHTRNLFRAISQNDFTKAKRFVVKGADLYAHNEDGATAVDVAIRLNRFDIADLLLSVAIKKEAEGADPDLNRLVIVDRLNPPTPQQRPALQSPLYLASTPKTLVSISVPQAPKVMSLGESLFIGKRLKASSGSYCRRKNALAPVFCMEDVHWPKSLEPFVKVKAGDFKALKAMVRYENGKASQIRSVFPSDSFDLLVGVYQRRFGENIKLTDPLDVQTAINPTVIWKRMDPVSGHLTYLEIRKHNDNLDVTIAAKKHGLILLYHEPTTVTQDQNMNVELAMLMSKH